MASIEEDVYRHSIEKPDKTALIDAASGEAVSYKTLWDMTLRAASWYRAKGISRGERVILAANKQIGFVAAYLGAHIAGIITVPIDSETNSERLSRIIGQAFPRLIIGNLRVKTDLEEYSFEETAKGNADLEAEFPEPEDIVDLLFTTGTTGLPKGVALSSKNEAAAARNINSFIGNTKEDIELIALPISHSFGLGRVRCVLSKGATAVLLGSFASMKRFYKAIEEFKVTGFGMVPASWAYISKMSGDRIAKFSGQLKYIEIGSAPLPLQEKHRLMKLLPYTRICMHYGLTEASRSAFISFHDDGEHLDTAGKASPNVEIAIFSTEGERLAADTEGEVCVKGDHVCKDYWGLPEAEFRKDFFSEWFRTGDWGSLSSSGWLSLKGRNKEMINVGGKKVNPLEVEKVLLSIPGIKDCACIAKPDSVLGESVKACIVEKSPIADETILAAASKALENYKVPAEIERVTEIPRTSSGKIQRLKLK